MEFQSGMILPTSLFEAFKHPFVGPLISLIARFFVGFPAVFSLRLRARPYAPLPPQLHAQCHLRGRRRLSLAIAQVHQLYELDGRAPPRTTLEVPRRALAEICRRRESQWPLLFLLVQCRGLNWSLIYSKSTLRAQTPRRGRLL